MVSRSKLQVQLNIMNLKAARKFPFLGSYDYLKGQDLDNVLKSRYISLSTKVHKVKAMIFPVVMYGCEWWTIKIKAERPRIDAFELWCWRRLLRVPWKARSDQAILKEINPEYSLKGLMLKLQYFGHLMQRADSLEKILMLEKIEGGKKKGMTEDEMVKDREA